MESSKDSKRRKDKNSDEEERRRESKSKRARTRSRSPAENRERDSRRKRRHSRSRSPDVPQKQEKQTNPENESDAKKEAPTRRAKETDMLNTRTGGAYIPPARLRLMQAQITDKSSVAYQRIAWEALKKSIHGHINKINVGNIGIIIKELLRENIVRGRGLLCRSVIQAQAASPTFTNVYAALVAAVNSRFPNIGELLLKRLMIQFKRGFKRNDKPICISSASFIAHLVNQRVAHEILALELLTLLVETPTDDSVEVAISFLKECGQKLTEVSSKGVNAIFEMLRNILHEGQLDKRVQYMIEVMFQVWKDGFKDHPALIEELELVPEEDQFTHLIMLDEATDPQDILNVFKFDDKYEENEQKYKTLSKEILGSDAESGDEDSDGESGSEEDEDDEDQEQKAVTIIDNTETNLVALRRTIYLTINSSLDFEECAHKLMKMQLKPGQEVELCHMFLDCCAEQRTYEKFYGLLAQTFCNINRIYIGPFEDIFKDSYGTAHRLDTNRLRNVSKFFAHLLFTDSISWEVLECVKLNEEDTTSSSRIYIKILFQELAEYMGLKKLNDRLKDPTLQGAFSGLFPRDNPKNTRFSINFFTSIGLGGLTDELREHLKQMPKNVPPQVTEIKLDSESSSDSSSDSSSSSSNSSSSSDSSSSDDEGEKSKKKKTKTKKKKNIEKEPETLAEQVANDKNDRWGHDGFYDTYGKDAQRLESRPDREDREDFARPWDKRNNQRNGDDRRGRRNDEMGDEFRRDRSRDDFRDRRDDRSQRDEGRNRYDDRGNEREMMGRRDDDRSRRYDDREDKNVDRTRRDEGRSNRGDERVRNNYRNRDESREDERSQRNDDRARKTDERAYKDDDRRNDDDRSRRGDARESKDSRVRKDDDRSRRGDERIRKGDDRPQREEERGRGDEEERDDRGRKVDDRARKDAERSRRNDDRNREDEDRNPKNEGKGRRDESKPYRGDDREDRGRRDDERQRRNDDRSRVDEGRDPRDSERARRDDKVRRGDEKEHRDDTVRKGEDRLRGDDDRPRRTDDREYREDRVQKGDERERRGERNRREEVEDQRSKNKVTENRTERDNSRRKERDDENYSKSKKKEFGKERNQNGDDGRSDDENYISIKNKDVIEENTSKKNEKEHKKSKKDKKIKKDKKKNKDVGSDTEDYSKKKSKHISDEQIKKREKRKKSVETESDSSSSSSSSSSEDDAIGPHRYWDKFDIKGKEIALEEKVKGRSRRTRS